MTTTEIPLIAAPQTLKITLGGVIYTLTLVYRGMWVMDIADAVGNPIVCGIALVTGADLLAQLSYLGIGGIMQVQSDGVNPDSVPTFSNLGQQAHLYWTAP